MIVIKIGGSAGVDQEAICDDVAALWREGQRQVIVHGGSARTNELAVALGHPPRFVTSPSGYTSRRTDRRTLEIFQMATCGDINKGLVRRLQQRGVNALGLSGMDGRLWVGPRKSTIRVVEAGRQRVIRDDFTGIVAVVNHSLLQNLIALGYLPVLAPPALSLKGEPINVDGDRAAAATAAALRAEQLVILSNVPGLLRDPADATSLLPRVARADLDAAGRHARGRMRIKLLGAQEALDGGVRRVVLADGREAEPLRRALRGVGTVICGEAS